MASTIPTWIDTCYVQNILHKMKYGESVRISSVTVKPATVKGDNYLSDMYRVGVEFMWYKDGHEIEETASFIAKVAPATDTLPIADIFETETLMMLNILPRMNQMLAELGRTPLSAKCLLVKQENPIHLLFEDLASRGFRMLDRQTGLDMDHCSLALQNLGQFHACSVALREENPEALTKYTKGLFRKEQCSALRNLFKAGVKALAIETREWDELHPRISEKLLKLSEVVFEKGCEVARYREDEFNVLNHGDCWVNNMLFRHDEFGKPVDHVFVDFQISHYGSPALDILNFLATSPSYDVRMKHRESILRKYHNSLSNTMVELKCKTEIPSFDDLQEILKRRVMCEAISAFVGLPIILQDKSEGTSFDEMISYSEEKPAKLGYRGSVYKKIMLRLLPFYDSIGLLDD